MNKEKLEALLDQSDKTNIICKNIELRPKVIADFIMKLANLTGDYQNGYLIIGVSEEDKRTINGFSPRFNIELVLQNALKQLSFQPEVKEDIILIQGKKVYVITVRRTDYKITVGQDILSKYETLIDRIMKACIKIQRSDGFKDKSEDERTDMIRDLLQMVEDVSKEKKYQISGQERQGTTKAGKASGEVDLLICNMEGITVSVVEALNLKSLDTIYLNEHIDKVYKYDTLGIDINFLISYVKVAKFDDFWRKYVNHISTYSYPCPLVKVDQRIIGDHDYADLKYICTHHNRNEKETVLFQICMKIIQ
jgi:hypothetical protein